MTFLTSTVTVQCLNYHYSHLNLHVRFYLYQNYWTQTCLPVHKICVKLSTRVASVADVFEWNKYVQTH